MTMDRVVEWDQCITGCNDLVATMDERDEPTCAQDCYRMYVKDLLSCVGLLDEGADFPTFMSCMFRSVVEGSNCLVYCPPVPTL